MEMTKISGGVQDSLPAFAGLPFGSANRKIDVLHKNIKNEYEDI